MPGPSMPLSQGDGTALLRLLLLPLQMSRKQAVQGGALGATAPRAGQEPV